MTQKLCDQLIGWYEESIELVKKLTDMKSIYNNLSDRKVNVGICSCADKIFNDYSLYENSGGWVESFKSTDRNSIYWFSSVPYDGKTKEEVIDLLQKRVDRLKTFSEPQTTTI